MTFLFSCDRIMLQLNTIVNFIADNNDFIAVKSDTIVIAWLLVMIVHLTVDVMAHTITDVL